MRRRPFQETIIDMIKDVSCNELALLARLICETQISSGHDQIIEAWQKKRAGLILGRGFDFDVVGELLKQKEEARKRDEEETQRLFDQALREENGVIPSAYTSLY